MAFSKDKIRGVHTNYGTREVGGVSGTDGVKGISRPFVWVFKEGYELNNRYQIPENSSIYQVNMTGAGSVTVGGKAIAAATNAAPVVAGGEVAWVGAKTGDELVIYFTHIA